MTRQSSLSNLAEILTSVSAGEPSCAVFARKPNAHACKKLIQVKALAINIGCLPVGADRPVHGTAVFDTYLVAIPARALKAAVKPENILAVRKIQVAVLHPYIRRSRLSRCIRHTAGGKTAPTRF